MVTPKGSIISLKFSPGLKKEFTLIGENLRNRGIDIQYILADRYRLLEHNVEKMNFITRSNNIREIFWDTFKLILNKRLISYFDSDTRFVLIYNAHLLNLFILNYIKKRYKNIQTILYLHDPYKPDKKPYGVIRSFVITLIELMQKLSVTYLDHVIFPSEYSQKVFLDNYKLFNGVTHIAPLMVPDSFKGHTKNYLARNFFSMVGAFNYATGHDTFTDLINYVAENNYNFKFIYISSSNIAKMIERLSPKARNYVEIINKKIIKDSEINDVIIKSYAVFRLDKEVTQSGVIPVAYMNKTPIIARDIPGLSQHVKDTYNGFLVPVNCSPCDLINAMDAVVNNFNKLSVNARHSYEDIWAEWNFERYYDWLINIT